MRSAQARSPWQQDVAGRHRKLWVDLCVCVCFLNLIPSGKACMRTVLHGSASRTRLIIPNVTLTVNTYTWMQSGIGNMFKIGTFARIDRSVRHEALHGRYIHICMVTLNKVAVTPNWNSTVSYVINVWIQKLFPKFFFKLTLQQGILEFPSVNRTINSPPIHGTQSRDYYGLESINTQHIDTLLCQQLHSWNHSFISRWIRKNHRMLQRILGEAWSVKYAKASFPLGMGRTCPTFWKSPTQVDFLNVDILTGVLQLWSFAMGYHDAEVIICCTTIISSCNLWIARPLDMFIYAGYVCWCMVLFLEVTKNLL